MIYTIISIYDTNYTFLFIFDIFVIKNMININILLKKELKDAIIMFLL